MIFEVFLRFPNISRFWYSSGARCRWYLPFMGRTSLDFEVFRFPTKSVAEIVRKWPKCRPQAQIPWPKYTQYLFKSIGFNKNVPKCRFWRFCQKPSKREKTQIAHTNPKKSPGQRPNGVSDPLSNLLLKSLFLIVFFDLRAPPETSARRRCSANRLLIVSRSSLDRP